VCPHRTCVAHSHVLHQGVGRQLHADGQLEGVRVAGVLAATGVQNLHTGRRQPRPGVSWTTHAAERG
jgi:hypothetical protein